MPQWMWSYYRISSNTAKESVRENLQARKLHCVGRDGSKSKYCPYRAIWTKIIGFIYYIYNLFLYICITTFHTTISIATIWLEQSFDVTMTSCIEGCTLWLTQIRLKVHLLSDTICRYRSSITWGRSSLLYYINEKKDMPVGSLSREHELVNKRLLILR